MARKAAVLFIILVLLATMPSACSIGLNNSKEDKGGDTTSGNTTGSETTRSITTGSNTTGSNTTGEGLNFTRETYPRVDGSTATIPLSEAVAVELLKISGDEAKEFIKHNKTHQAYVNLVDGLTDIIFVTEPSDEELALAGDKGIELEVIPVVKEAFVFLVNKRNPVESLTIEQIQGIYQGKIINWNEVGGEEKEIIAYQRPQNSGSQTIMEKMVMKGLKMADAPTELKPLEMGELIEKVAGFDNSDRALGYSVFYFANSMYNKETIKFLAVNGVKPDTGTIRSDEYPFTSAYYAVLRKSEPADSSARALLGWLLSADGQRTAEKAGYIPLK